MAHTIAIMIIKYPIMINPSANCHCLFLARLPTRKERYPVRRKIKGHLKKCKGLILEFTKLNGRKQRLIELKILLIETNKINL